MDVGDCAAGKINFLTEEVGILKCLQTEPTLKDAVLSIVNIVSKGKDDRIKCVKALEVVYRMISNANCKLPSHLYGLYNLESVFITENISALDVLETLKITDVITLGNTIITSTLSCKLKNILLKTIIHMLYNTISHEVYEFLLLVWNNRDFIQLDTEIFEDIMLYFPFWIERTLLLLLQKCSGASQEDMDTVLKDEGLLALSEICAKSSKVFQLIVTLLLEFLIVSDIDKNIFLLIRKFVKFVEKRCTSGHFIELFPNEQQVLVVYLSIEPQYYPIDFNDKTFILDYVLQTLVEQINSNRRIGGALLNYYPNWLQYVLRHCKENEYFHLLPRTTEAWNSAELYLKFLLS